jgi:phosphogluconate dehydratase
VASTSGGALAKVQDGDIVRVCARRGELCVLIDDAVFAARTPASRPEAQAGTGRELFAFMRHGVSSPEQGASAMLAAAEL